MCRRGGGGRGLASSRSIKILVDPHPFGSTEKYSDPLDTISYFAWHPQTPPPPPRHTHFNKQIILIYMYIIYITVYYEMNRYIMCWYIHAYQYAMFDQGLLWLLRTYIYGRFQLPSCENVGQM